MKTINCILTELKKAVISPSFSLCVITSFALFFTASCHVDRNGKEYSIFDIMTTFTSEQIYSNTSFSAWSIFMSGSTAIWLHMFIPIVAAFPFIPVFCDERSGGGIRNTVIRMGKRRYNLSKFAAAFVSGGLGVTLGYALFGIVIAAVFPPLSSYNADMGLYNQIYFPNGIVMGIISRLFGMFLFGAFFALIAFTLSAFVRNKYLVMCFPFMLKYIYDQIISKISIEAVQSGNYEFAEKIGLFNTYSLLYYNMQGDNTAMLLFGYAFLAVMFFAVFSIFMNRRLDLGA